MRIALFVLLPVAAFAAGLVLGARRALPASSAPAGSRSRSPSDAAARPTQPGATGATDGSRTPEGYGLSPATRHYGELLEGQTAAHTVTVERPAGTRLRLGRLYSPCPCVFVAASQRTFAPGEPAEIRIRLVTRSLTGEKRFPAYVEIAEPVHAILRTDVAAAVARVPAKLALAPEALHLGAIDGEARASVTLHNLTARPVQIRILSCSVAGVKATAPDGARIPPGGAARVRVATPARGLPAGPLRGVVSLETDCPAHERMAIPVEGTSRGGRP